MSAVIVSGRVAGFGCIGVLIVACGGTVAGQSDGGLGDGAAACNSDAMSSCLPTPLKWEFRRPGVPTVDVSVIEGCGNYTHSRSSPSTGNLSCAQHLDACAVDAEWLATAQSQLVDVDVIAAFATGGTYGLQGQSEEVTITLNGQTVTIGVSCAGADSSPACVVPQHLEFLRDALVTIDILERGMGQCGDVYHGR